MVVHAGFLFFGGIRSILCLCLQLEKISLLLVRVAPSGANAIKNFSLVQSAQIPLTGLKGFAWSMISHFTLKFTSSFLRVFVCVLKVVWFSSGWLNEKMCPFHLDFASKMCTNLFVFGMSGRRCSRSPFRRSTGNDVSGH